MISLLHYDLSSELWPHDINQKQLTYKIQKLFQRPIANWVVKTNISNEFILNFKTHF